MAKKYGIKNEAAAIITGASTGIGRALAICLAESFAARLVLNARNQELLNETASLVRQHGGQAVTVPGDIGKQETAAMLVEACLSNFGAVDLLVNNAGLAKPGPADKLSTDDWHYVFDVNFFGALYATYAVLPYFLEKGAGKIVNVASVAGKVSFPGSVCYSASKFAMTGMSEGMAAEFACKGIDVITVCPGWVRTEFFEHNQVTQGKNPTLIALRSDFKGWLMRNCLSMSSQQASLEIIKSCQKGGPQEIILTGPGIFIERMKGLFPSLVASLSSKIPTVLLEKQVPDSRA